MCAFAFAFACVGACISLSACVFVLCFQTFMHFFQSASAFSATDTECCLARAVKGKRTTTSYNKRFVRRGSTTAELRHKREKEKKNTKKSTQNKTKATATTTEIEQCPRNGKDEENVHTK